jgi:hypothetical protein
MNLVFATPDMHEQNGIEVSKQQAAANRGSLGSNRACTDATGNAYKQAN